MNKKNRKKNPNKRKEKDKKGKNGVYKNIHECLGDKICKEYTKLKRTNIIPQGNYRKTHNLPSIKKLAQSIAWFGQIDPVLVTPMTDGNYELLGGERRYLACEIAGIEEMDAIILHDLTDEQKVMIRLTENTQDPISNVDKAYSINRMMFYKLSQKAGIPCEELEAYQSYWEIPLAIRMKYPVAKLAKHLKKGKDTIRRALYLHQLHQELLSAVNAGNLSYAKAVELGRIANKNLQRILNAQHRELNAKDLAKIVTKTLHEHDKALQKKKQREVENFCLSRQKITTSYDQYKKDLLSIVNNQQRFMVSYIRAKYFRPDLIDLTFTGREELIDSLFFRAKGVIDSLWKKIEKENSKEELKEVLTEKIKIPIKQQIMGGRYKLKDLQQSSLFEEERKTVDINVDKIFLDTKNVRKRYNQKYIESIARSYAYVGQLVPIIVTKRDKKYRIVVGHCRYKAKLVALKNGWTQNKKMVVFIENLSDDECRQIQFEEDSKVPVREGEKAEGIYRLYTAMQQIDDSYSIDSLVEDYPWLKVGEVKSALLYHTLDDKTKQLEHEGYLKYGIAVRLAGITDITSRHRLAVFAIASNYSVKQMEKIIQQEKNYDFNRTIMAIAGFTKEEDNKMKSDGIYGKLSDRLRDELASAYLNLSRYIESKSCSSQEVKAKYDKKIYHDQDCIKMVYKLKEIYKEFMKTFKLKS
ncbi:hypothetical protein DRJ17_05400 [Candidatus Woesearchaeota archaeon]|nr:MAG: hypothetical protein DRJ17_05400 [Candidatus Woesearchaeota archaeon]